MEVEAIRQGASFDYNSAKKPFFSLPDLFKHGYKKCCGCGNACIYCHNVLIGPFCMFEVISTCTNQTAFVDDTILKKVFIGTYNSIQRYKQFVDKKVVGDDWSFPLPVYRTTATIIPYSGLSGGRMESWVQ